MSVPKIVVYTAISKGYDWLKPVPPLWRAMARFVAFLEEPQSVLGWEIRSLHHGFNDPCRNAKIHKILPHRYFPDADFSLWVDGSVELKSQLPIQLWPEEFLGKHDLAVFKHTFRRCIYVEGAWCIMQGYDDAFIIDQQMEKYFKQGFPRDSGLALCLVLFRRHCEKTKKFNEAWWREISAYSRRDQLSFNYTAQKQGLRFRYFPWKISHNPHFTLKRHTAPRSQSL